eukprot:NODE_511_length_6663_cov_0.324345.p3 type:complete len:494 gc:universal NODE_511_length_6663_cov_0.324345:2390-3871(+)
MIIEKDVAEMLAADMIEVCETSEYTHETVLVKKKGTDKWRFCVDFRPLNLKLRLHNYPQAELEANILRFAGLKYFCKFDLRSGYWQLYLEPDCRRLTAFYANGKLYQFKMLPFGIANAPGWFQQIMDNMLQRYPWAKAFQDDVSFGASTFDELEERLDQLLELFIEYNVKLNAKKCAIGFSQMNLLGHVVDRTGTRPAEDKVYALIAAKSPASKDELRSFNGCMQWHQRYVPEYSMIASDMLKMLRKGQHFEWTLTHEQSYRQLLAILAKRMVLHYPDPNKPYQIRTDAASKSGLGAILLQDGLPIHFWSRTLSERELNWHVTELECLAIVEALKRFERYVMGQEITIFTDHCALSWLLAGREALKGKLYRWSIYLSQFNLKIVYIAGNRNLDADFLSRHPCAADAQTIALSLMTGGESLSSIVEKCITYDKYDVNDVIKQTKERGEARVITGVPRSKHIQSMGTTLSVQIGIGTRSMGLPVCSLIERILRMS